MQGLWDDPRLRGRLPASRVIRLRRVVPLAATILSRLLTTLRRPDRSREQLGRDVERFVSEMEARADAASTLTDRVALLDEVTRRLFPFIIPNIAPRLGPGLGPLIALRLLCRETPGAPDVLELVRGLPHNVTTEMDLALWASACTIRRDFEGAACFAECDAAELGRRYLAGRLPRAAQDGVREFMDRYGMRGVAEIDLGRPRWREDPTAIMQVLKSYLEIEGAEQAPDAAFARGAADAEAAIEVLVQAARATRAGWLKSRGVRWAVRRMRSLAGLRESPKFTAIRVLGLAREGLLASGRELCDAGALERPDDLFYLHLSELRELAAGAQSDWPEIVAERRRSYRREQQRRQIPRVLLSDGEALFAGLTPADAGGGDLAGSPVSPGVVEGVVRVLLDPRGARLAPGEILVCPATDPGWTPLFLAAGRTDHGGGWLDDARLGHRPRVRHSCGRRRRRRHVAARVGPARAPRRLVGTHRPAAGHDRVAPASPLARRLDQADIEVFTRSSPSPASR